MSMDTKPGHGEKYEKSDLHMKRMWSFAWTLLGLMFAGLFVTFLMYAGYARLWTSEDAGRQPSRLAAALPSRPPEPRLQDLPGQDLKAFRERESITQHSYAWVEPAAGVVRIPVERAMELALERGLPVRAAGGADKGKGERGKGNGNAAPAKKR